ncbi:DUF1761 domain-containing protein [Flavicella sediminum]|uniref:DUF1761 domain-containing protein n=1 Tax=Flavicella sediminum TaxID=2585141 RepID=UPI0011216F01|nr:DUF1761 domain-containing protein [Flavicella sediminum]
MKFNLIITAVAAIIPLFMGFIWYNPKVFGKAWMKECQFTPESIGKPNPMIFVYCYLLSFLLAFMLSPIVIHQFGVFSVLIDEPGILEVGSDINAYFTDFMSKYGTRFRTFPHGALHGTMVGLLIVLPVMGTNAMFEKRSFKYVLINSSYWIVSIALMGGIICKFA